MDKWLAYFRKHAPRRDRNQAFYPEENDDYRPALLNTGATLSAALVANRLLETIAKRGGTRVKPSLLEKIASIVEACLPVETVQHCEEEVLRILAWIEDPELTVEETPPRSATPELDMMYEADLESRISVARFALGEGYDLELEFYDEERKLWPRMRVTPLEIILRDDLQDDDQRDQDALLVRDLSKREHEIPIHALRWLMPVTRKEESSADRPSHPVSRGADVLTFPARPRPAGREDEPENDDENEE